ncbi:hypothetical protein [Lysinibacillus xylanilyticus]|uniref:hypothetical protein n=1 Tax=Lysinibacillus xylanilyticus TaxID=582475 RepID=UPI003828C154
MNKQESISDEQLVFAKRQEEEITKILENKLKTDEEFQQSYKDLMMFYSKKIIQQAKTTEQREAFIEIMENTVTQQFFHGYYLMSLLDKDMQSSPENKEIYLEYYKLPKGILQLQVVSIMNDAFKNIDAKWYMNTPIEQYNTYLLKELPDIYEVYHTILKEIACYGAYIYMTDQERYAPPVEDPDAAIMLLGYPYDIKFLNPQVYIKASYYSEEHELWDVFKIGDERGQEKWVGTVHISAIPIGNENKIQFILNFSLSVDIRLDERNLIISNLYHSLSEEIKDTAETRVYTVNDVDFVEFPKIKQ